MIEDAAEAVLEVGFVRGADPVTDPAHLSQQGRLLGIDGDGVLDRAGALVGGLVLSYSRCSTTEPRTCTETAEYVSKASSGDRPASTRLAMAFSISSAPSRAAFGLSAARIRIRSHRIDCP